MKTRSHWKTKTLGGSTVQSGATTLARTTLSIAIFLYDTQHNGHNGNNNTQQKVLLIVAFVLLY
jgi:hypothetical protein